MTNEIDADEAFLADRCYRFEQRWEGFHGIPELNRLIDEVLEELGLVDSKPVAAPAVKDGGPALRESADLLGIGDAAVSRASGRPH